MNIADSKKHRYVACITTSIIKYPMIHPPRFAALCGLLSFVLSACMTPTTPQMNAQFGKATRAMFVQQIENPGASKNTAVPLGMAAEAMSGLNNYHKSFAVKSSSGPAASGGNSSGSGGGSESMPRQPNGDMNAAAANQSPVFKTPLSPPSTLDGLPLPSIGGSTTPPGIGQSFTAPNGQRFEGIAGGSLNTNTNQFWQQTGGGMTNTTNGQFMIKP